MKRRFIACIILTALTFTSVVGGSQTKGRYKKDGDQCVWDVNDSGPNQCTPRTPGRFKKSGDSCVWDATPPQGRWKTAGNRCVWDAKDTGPSQCNPRQPRKSSR
jgi:hypothetical protein